MTSCSLVKCNITPLLINSVDYIDRWLWKFNMNVADIIDINYNINITYNMTFILCPVIYYINYD